MAWKEEMQKVYGEVEGGAYVWRGGCLIEGHKGLLAYSPTLVKVRRRRGTLSVSGEGLTLAAVSREEVWIAGKVTSVTCDA